ncbi:MAG: hypothetical protein JSU68_08490, partial [Phycisphaerales bacterium]
MAAVATDVHVLDGKKLAGRIKEQVRADAADLAAEGRPVSLHAILVGDPPDGRLYANSQARQCERVGIRYTLHDLPGETSPDALAEEIGRLNADPAVTGIMLHLPVPEHISAPAMQYLIDPYKDVEGVNPANIGFVFYDRP